MNGKKSAQKMFNSEKVWAKVLQSLAHLCFVKGTHKLPQVENVNYCLVLITVSTKAGKKRKRRSRRMQRKR